MYWHGSRLALRDDTTYRTLAQAIVPGTQLRDGLSVDELVELLPGRSIHMRIAAMGGSDGVLHTRLGNWLRQAQRIDLVVNEGRNLGTRSLAEELRHVLTLRIVRNDRGGLFHPKVVITRLALPDERQLLVAIVGSANLTGGGMAVNDELGVLHAEEVYVPAAGADLRLLRWPAISAALDAYWAKGTEVDPSSLPTWVPDRTDALTRDPTGPLVRGFEAPSGSEPQVQQEPAPADDDCLRQLLETQLDESLRRLCHASGLPVGRGKPGRIKRLEQAYAGRASDLISLLRAGDLRGAIHTWAYDRGLGFSGVSRATKAELDAVTRRLFLEGWVPAEDEAALSGGDIVAWWPPDSDELESESPLADSAYGDSEPRDDRDADDEDSSPREGHQFPPFTIVTVGSASTDRPDNDLEDFQQEAVAALTHHFGSYGRQAGILCLPTGGGKTRTALQWLMTHFIGRGQRVAWIAPRLQLLDQAQEDMHGLAWLLRGLRETFTISRYEGRWKDLTGDIVLMSAASLAHKAPTVRQLERSGNGPLGIVCYDEAHRAIAPATQKGIQRLRGATSKQDVARVPLLGLTATPFRGTERGTERLLKYFGGEPLFERSFGALIQKNFLARPTFVRHRMLSTSDFRLRREERDEISRLGEVSRRVLSRLARHPRRDDEIVELWCRRRSAFGKTIAFACDIEHAESLAGAFRRAGQWALEIHSDLPLSERSERLRHFNEREGPGVMVNVGILTEGANIPTTKTVLMARPTLSPVLYTQMIGRGARGPKTVRGKTDFFVVDCVDNFALHGFRLAGALVAQELGEEIRDADDVDWTRKAAGEPDRRAAIEGLAWLLQQGFEAEEYRLWGMLSWEPRRGPSRSVGVFVEGLAAVQHATELVGEACRGKCTWDTARELGDKLEESGAMPARHWLELVEDAIEVGRPPRLERVELDLDMEAARALAIETATPDSKTVVTPKGPSQGSASEWEEMAFHFVHLAVAVARADEHVHPDEVRATRHAVLALLGEHAGDLDVDALISQSLSEIIDATGSARRLRETLDLDRRLALLDSLMQVATADGRFVPEERSVIQRVGALLELPESEVQRRIELSEDLDAGVRTLPDGFRVCPSCRQTMEPSAAFCGYCGKRLRMTDYWGEVSTHTGPPKRSEPPPPVA